MKKSRPVVRNHWLKPLVWSAVVCSCAMIVLSAAFPPPPLIRADMYSTVVADREGNVLRMTLSADNKYRIRTKLSDFPRALREAILLKEDRHFYLHNGVNPVALCGAFCDLVANGRAVRGASTITMQLARLLYRLDTRSVSGKMAQIMKALEIERFHSKDEILEAYLNLVPCGSNIEGFGTASLVYFCKKAGGLTLSEALTLAVIPQNPNARAPRPDAENGALIAARDALYDLWCTENPADRSQAVEFKLPVRFSFNIPFRAGHYTDYLLARRPPGAFELAGTLDPDAQALIGDLAAKYVARNAAYGVKNAAALLVDFRSLEVRALLGSADFFDAEIDGQVNGTNAKRSPGSTIKPFIYALAMEQGKIHPATMLKDARADFSSYHPDNFDGEFEGPVKAVDALNRSRNVPAVYIASLLENPGLYEFLVKAGVRGLKDESHYGLSLVLGGAEMTMAELVTLYAMLANGGELKELVYEKSDKKQTGQNPRLLSPEACFLVLSMLEQNPQTRAFLCEASAGNAAFVYWKTGTSLGFKDAWTVGIFDNYVLAVWVGNFDGTGNPYLTGSRAAAPLFFELVNALRQNGLTTAVPLTSGAGVPAGVTRIEVCGLSGGIPNECCPHRIQTWFAPGLSPISICNIHREIFVDRRTGFRRTEFVPGETDKVVWEFWPSDLQAVFKNAGMPKKNPPGYDPAESIMVKFSAGSPPEIVSPLSRIRYVTRPMFNENRAIPFIATADADAGLLFWFLDGRFVGQSPPETAFFWEASPGTYDLRCVDENGRSCGTTLCVISSD